MIRALALFLALALAALPHPQAAAAAPARLPAGAICGADGRDGGADSGGAAAAHCPDCLPAVAAALLPGRAAPLPFRPPARRLARRRVPRAPAARRWPARRARAPPPGPDPRPQIRDPNGRTFP